jgi:hypothetical protein
VELAAQRYHQQTQSRNVAPGFRFLLLILQPHFFSARDLAAALYSTGIYSCNSGRALSYAVLLANSKIKLAFG